MSQVILPAVIGLVGVILGSLLTTLKDVLLADRTRRQRAAYLAVRCVTALDAYVVACANAMSPDPDQEDGPFFSIKMPEGLRLPDDVDWSSASPELAFAILSLPNDEAEAKASVHFLAGVRDSDEAQDEMFTRFSDLGLRAHELARRLRGTYRLPEWKPDRWDPVERLNAKQTELRAASSADRPEAKLYD